MAKQAELPYKQLIDLDHTLLKAPPWYSLQEDNDLSVY